MRFYAGVLLGMWGLFGSSILVLAIWLQPLEGDLTRIGGYPENLYGWQSPQVRFIKNFSGYSELGDEVLRSPDLLVYGDSFSHIGVFDQRRFGWQNFFHQQTGLSVYTYHYSDLDLEELLLEFESGTLKPGVFLFQFVERGLLRWARRSRYCQLDGAPGKTLEEKISLYLKEPQTPFSMQPLDAAPIDLKTEQYQREREAEAQWDQAGQMLRAQLLNEKVTRFSMNSKALFSSERADDLLVLSSDLKKADRKSIEEKQLLCVLKKLNERVTAAGVAFVFMPAPDKLSLYQDAISQSAYQSWLDRDDWPVPVVPVLSVLEQGVAAGEKDLYLPNDTHWGWRGNQFVAQAVVQLLQEQNWIRFQHKEKIPSIPEKENGGRKQGASQ